MSTEKAILNKINNLSSNLIITLYETRILLNEVNDDIKRINNTYFLQNNEIMSRLNSILSEQGLKELSFLLTDYKTYIEYKSNICCNHIWTKDIIDIDPDRTKSIVYCSLCEITQK